jgi:uncharacterized protein (TIGR03067 family)
MRSVSILLVLPTVLLLAAETSAIENAGKDLDWKVVSVDDGEKDLAKMQGTWKLVSVEFHGWKVPDIAFKDVMVVIARNKITFKFRDKIDCGSTFKLDPRKQPASFDSTADSGEDKGKLSLGIYAFDGNKLKLSWSGPGEGRPKEFGTKDGSKQELWVLQKK